VKILRTILLVDDDDGVRCALRAFLEGHGLAVAEASSAIEALKRADTLNESLAVLVTDAVMPGMSGTALAHILMRKYLNLPVVFMSGYPAGGQIHELFERTTFLQKPFSGAELINAVSAGLEKCPTGVGGKGQ
jgi:two-component system cell cycle sensor histidine kinase/response regulator CckA